MNSIKLGYVEPSAETQLVRATRTNIQALRQERGLPSLIPRSEWVEKDFVSPLGKKFINNQKSCSGCSGWSAAQGSMRSRAIRGLNFARLSGAAIYAMCNGGHDNGSNIGDTMRALEQHGTCLESEMNFPQIYPSEIPQDKLRYKETDPITCASFDEVMTCVQMDMPTQLPVNADSSWVTNRGFDVNGVASYTNSGRTNHSVHVAGAVCLNGTWYLIMPNTWDITWGPFYQREPKWYDDFVRRNNITPVDSSRPLAGCCLLTEDHVNQGAYADDGYAHGSPVDP